MASTTPEGKIKRKVDQAAKRLTRTYRFMPVQTGMGARTLDYLFCICGLFVAVETKAPGKDLTDYQKDTKRKIEEAGGVVFKISSEEELTAFVDFAHELGAETIQ